MTDRYLAPDEWLAALKHMSDPIVLVEGNDDVQICRWAAERVGNRRLDIQPAGGRQTLLALYQRRSEYAHLSVAFVADRDLSVFCCVPQGYDDVIWTEGYSIENDIYADVNLEDLLNADEVDPHRETLESLVEWFAFEVEQHLDGCDAHINKHLNQIVPPGETKVDPDLLASRQFRQPDAALHQQIQDDYQLQLRGKFLFQLLYRFVNASGRGTKYNIRTLHENAVKSASSVRINRIISEVEQKIEEHTTSSHISAS